VIEPAEALIIMRAAAYGSAIVVFGCAYFLALLATPLVADALHKRLSHVARICGIVLLASAIAALPLQAAQIGEGWPDALSPSMIGDLIGETGIGHITLSRIALAAALLAFLFGKPDGLRQRALPIILVCGLFIASLALSGHAVMHADGLGLAHRINHALHALAGAVWLGALIPLWHTVRRLRDAALRPSAVAVLARFSGIGALAVALSIATGSANTILVLGRWPLDWTSPYQTLLAAKISCVVAMLGLAALNRLWLVPRANTGNVQADAALAWTIAAEIVLGALVLMLVATFGTFEPV
jgi:putative copper resistance protein D